MAKTPKSKCSHPRAARYYNGISKGNAKSGYSCSDCEMEGLEAPVAPGILAPGIYKLEAPVANLGKDGRSRAWNGQPEFPVGTYFVNQNFRQRISDDFEDYGCSVQRYGSRFDRVEPDHRGYDALVAALTPSEGTTEEFLECQREQKHYAADAKIILAQMINSGKLTRADILASIEATDAAEQAERNAIQNFLGATNG